MLYLYLAWICCTKMQSPLVVCVTHTHKPLHSLVFEVHPADSLGSDPEFAETTVSLSRTISPETEMM